MFFVTYLRRELRRRMRQAVFIALGLAVGVGLVVTVMAASSGVKKAQADVLRSLYGVGTDITVTGKPPAFKAFQRGGGGGVIFQGGGFGGPRICQDNKCHNAAGQTIDSLRTAGFGAISQSKVSAVRRLKGVQAAAGGLVLTDTKFTFPKSFGQPGGQGQFQPPTSLSVDGVDTSHLSLGPLTAGTITSGHTLTSADANADVAVVDSGYATSNKLKVGSTISIASHKFAVVGIVTQPQGASPADAYIPLAKAQALGTADGTSGKSLKGDVNAIYVTAASAADIGAVQREVNKLLPGDTVTTAASLAAEVTGSLSSASKLANDLGKWLSIVVLIAAVAVASLLTLAAVARRVREFGALKALGWRSRRIIAQVMAESLITGIIGGAVGVGLGFAGAAIVTSVAPNLSATVPGPVGPRVFTAGGGGGATFGGGGPRFFGQAPTHALSVPMSASVTTGAIAIAVLLAIVGGLLAGSFGSWRIAGLRPADALTRVA